MKKIIYVFGVIFLALIIIVNFLFTAYLDMGEHITIYNNSLIYVIGLIIAGIAIFGITNIIDKKLCSDETSKVKKKIRRGLFISVLVIYILFNILWIIFVRPSIIADQIHVCNLAQTMFRGNEQEVLLTNTYAGIPLSQYIEAYQQQIPLAFVYSVFFRIINYDGIGLLRILNVIGNILIVFSIYKIGMQLSKKYKINKVLILTFILTFISLPILSTFIYGDIPSTGLCLLAVYYTMRYSETKKIKFICFASIATMIAYMMRMNSLIFIIATVIYLLLNLFNGITKRKAKENLINTAVIIMYIVISILPSRLITNYYLNKYNLDKEKSYPTISFLLIAMEEGPRANGWYNEEIGEPALKDPENKKVEYKEKVKERLKYFIENPMYTFDFYMTKITSMWTENTYSALRQNFAEKEDKTKENILTFYQKVLLILICICSIIVLVQNRKDISLDVIFLLTIFIGGFAFHILWEAKSRYIIPYIIVLMPIASIYINKINIKEKIKNTYLNIKSNILEKK